MKRRTCVLALSATALVPHFSRVARAQGAAASFPDRPIRWIVPYPPGGITDELARTFGEKLQEAWGQPVVVDNRAGGASNIGNQAVARSAPDGYTLLLAAPPLATNPALFGAKLGYDPARDLVPVSQLIWNPNAFMVRTESPFRSVGQLIAHAKANPGKISYGSAGIGTANHLGGELFKRAAGIDMTYVPYKGSAAVMQDLLAGTLDLASDNLATYVPQIRAGKVRALVVLGPSRISAVPDIPSMADAGFPGFDSTGWCGVSVPTGTPAVIVDKLSRELARIAALPDMKKRFEERGFTMVGGSPREFGALIERESKKLQPLIRELGIQPG